MQFIQKEINWLSAVIIRRLNTYFNKEDFNGDIYEITPPDILSDRSDPYASFIAEKGFGFEERTALALCFVPFISPEVMDCFCIKNADTGMRFTEFGCSERGNGKVLTPSLDTVLFILAGGDVERRIRLAAMFCSHDFFVSHCFSKESPGGSLDSFNSWLLRPSEELLDLIVLDMPYKPHFSEDFPAQRIETGRNWDELVLDRQTMKQIEEIRIWAQYGEEVRKEWGLENKLKPGYKALFYGPSGSGKTFTATLLGKATGRDVYRIDLSMMISKYIGETEKNLSKVFKVAEGKEWILFFDEADALFGKRTGIKDSHDRYANQEIAYLLQRIEDYPGLVILSTNLKVNIDEAFSRRFQSIIGFSLPDAELRVRLWEGTFSPCSKLEDDIDLEDISRQYELSGGSIINVVQYCSLMSYSRGETTIRKDDLLEGIRKEFLKDGKIAL